MQNEHRQMFIAICQTNRQSPWFFQDHSLRNDDSKVFTGFLLCFFCLAITCRNLVFALQSNYAVPDFRVNCPPDLALSINTLGVFAINLSIHVRGFAIDTLYGFGMLFP